MMIILNNLVSVFYDLRLIAFLAFFLTFIIFMDYGLQADPHKNKIENFKMLISKNTKRYIITILMAIFFLKLYALKNIFFESLHQYMRTCM